MAINKNFVVKNGLEVNQDLILADATTNKVGVGTSTPNYELHVFGGIGATDTYTSGISTISTSLNVGVGGSVFTVIALNTGVSTSLVGVGTTNPTYLLDIRSPVSTGQTAVYVQGDVRITGDLSVGDDISFDELNARNINVTGIATINELGVTGFAEISYLEVTGVSTFTENVDINSFVDISDNLNVVGLTTLGSYVDINDSVDISDNLNVVGLTTLGDVVDINSTVDISSTLNVGGISTFGSYVDINDSVDINVDLNVVGLTTLGSYVDINDSVDVSGDLNVTGISTIATVDINAGDIEVSNVDTVDLNVTGISTIATVDINAGDIEVSNVDTTDLNVTGISTLGTVQIFSGVVTSTSGIITYYGDGSYLTGNARNLTATIGIGTSGGLVGYGVSFLDLRGAGVSTSLYDSSVGIATIYFEGGGGGSASIGIGSTPGDAFVGIVTAGNLWYNTDLGRLFIYYQDTDSAQWVDAAPFNIGIITSLTGGVSFSDGTAASPSWYFIDDQTTGVFSPTNGELTFVSIGSSVLNINPSGINVTGIATAQDFDALSDINFKENVTTVNNALLKVEQLRGVKFDWKESGTPSYGVIAQELEQVLPELVHGNDPKTVNYNGIIGVLIEAIKELKSEIEELKSNK